MKKATLTLLVFSILISSCQEEPSACFEVSASSVSVNQNVFFSNCSINADSYEWNFGDGSQFTTTQSDPTYAYSNPGTYNVTLTTYSKNGKKSDSVSRVITVNAVDPCANVTCLNGGYCANGQCVCTEGFTGSNCSQQITPSQIRITKIVLDQFPPLDNGSDWDGFFCGTSYPDIFLTVENNGTIIGSTGNYSDCIPGTQYTFSNIGFPMSISSPNNNVVVRLYDYDTGGCAPDDYMGGLQNILYSSTNGFPYTYRLFLSSAQIDLTLHLEYVF